MVNDDIRQNWLDQLHSVIPPREMDLIVQTWWFLPVAVTQVWGLWATLRFPFWEILGVGFVIDITLTILRHFFYSDFMRKAFYYTVGHAVLMIIQMIALMVYHGYYRRWFWVIFLPLWYALIPTVLHVPGLVLDNLVSITVFGRAMNVKHLFALKLQDYYMKNLGITDRWLKQ